MTFSKPPIRFSVAGVSVLLQNAGRDAATARDIDPIAGCPGTHSLGVNRGIYLPCPPAPGLTRTAANQLGRSDVRLERLAELVRVLVREVDLQVGPVDAERNRLCRFGPVKVIFHDNDSFLHAWSVAPKIPKSAWATCAKSARFALKGKPFTSHLDRPHRFKP